jgi:hypothetical protein
MYESSNNKMTLNKPDANSKTLHKLKNKKSSPRVATKKLIRNKIKKK